MTAPRRLALIALVSLAAALAAVLVAPGSGSQPVARTVAAARPNIVFILADDLSWNLIDDRIAPHIAALQRRGETFTSYFVADSLCCPSRANVLTGLFPHDTRVTTNYPPHGGYARFQQRRLDRRTYAVALHRAGYRTSMLGKYLNGYGDPRMTARTAPIPPGWSDWHVSNHTGYLEFDYQLDDNGVIDTYGSLSADYGVDVLGTDARTFIQRSAGRPFAIEIAPFAPHAPYVPAPRNAGDFPGLRQPRDPSFNAQNADPPTWLGRREAFPPARVAGLDGMYRRRAQSVEALDALLANVEATLQAEHVDGDTYIVFTSDNGYHIGQHRLIRGKQTAFDTDIRVPLVVAGPGVPQGRVVGQVAQSIDLYPTFAALAGAAPATGVEGRSLEPLLHPTARAPAWRTVALVEHRGPDRDPADPDFEDGAKGSNPTSYRAIRIRSPHVRGFRGAVDAVYVEYADRPHEREFYDLARDPYERRNVARRLTGRQRRSLHAMLVRYARCHGARACWRAGEPRR